MAEEMTIPSLHVLFKKGICIISVSGFQCILSVSSKHYFLSLNAKAKKFVIQMITEFKVSSNHYFLAKNLK